MIRKGLQKINTVIDPRQKITPFGGIWWLRAFMERLGVGSVLNRGYGIKKRRRKFNESDYILSALYLLISGGKSISDIAKLRGDRAFEHLSGMMKGVPAAGALLKFFNIADGRSISRFQSSVAGFADRILRLMRNNRLRFGKVSYAFMDSSDLELYGKQFGGASINYNGDRVLRLHAVFIEDLLCGIQLHEANHFVTYPDFRSFLLKCGDFGDLVAVSY